jgi:small subunit ribosomal protein S1
VSDKLNPNLTEISGETDEPMSCDWPDDRFRELTQGQIIEAKVILVRDDAAFVDIGGKSDLTIPVEELAVKTVNSAKELVKPGDIITVMVMRAGEEDKVRLSKRLVDQEQIWFDLETAFKEGAPVTGKVDGVVKGGLNVLIGGIKAFMPASQATLNPSKDLSDLVGQEFPVKILEFDHAKHRVLVSRRELLAAEKKRISAEFFGSIKEGERRTGTITRLTDFGAFVDLGSGIEGLIHVSELSWQRVKSAKEILNEGDRVEVLITKVDPAAQKISLSLKQIQPHPWKEGISQFKEGEIYPGTVARLESFGVFVRLAPGIEGLIHISELSWERVKSAKEILSEGDKVDVLITKIDTAAQKVSLSLRQIKPHPWEAGISQFTEGEFYPGTVVRLESFGAFVRLAPGIDGMVHVSQIADKRIASPGEVLKIGDEVRARVLSVDNANRKISLSLREAAAVKEEEIEQAELKQFMDNQKEENITSQNLGALLNYKNSK